MIAGQVSDAGVPTVSITVGGRAWDAVIDTGFNGDLELPRELQPYVHAQLQGRIVSVLAGGQMVEEDSYRVEFPFDSQLVVAEATFVPQGDILIGTHLLRQYRLAVDFPSRSVQLEQVRRS